MNDWWCVGVQIQTPLLSLSTVTMVYVFMFIHYFLESFTFTCLVYCVSCDAMIINWYNSVLFLPLHQEETSLFLLRGSELDWHMCVTWSQRWHALIQHVITNIMITASDCKHTTYCTISTDIIMWKVSSTDDQLYKSVHKRVLRPELWNFLFAPPF